RPAGRRRLDPCTTLFEGWGIGPDGFGGGTTNHAWSGGPLTLLSQKVCGIEPTSPGFRSFKVCPQMGTLTETSATVDTHYGKIQVFLNRKGGKIWMTLSVPAGTTAEIPVSKGKVKRLEAGEYTLTIPSRTL
uniref:alpha-L-rhamnosidase C-terminal domain-containing protein n=1 Tax=uncultured Parabacteroides sp. TaxID=512312 RepID=UPI0025CE7359